MYWPSDPVEQLRLVTMGSAFALFLTIWFIVLAVWRMRVTAREELLRRRLELISRPGTPEGRILRLWTDVGEATTIVPGMTRMPLFGRFDQLRRLAGIQAPVPAILLEVSGGALVAGLAVLVILQNILVAGCAALVVVVGAWIYLRQRILRRVVLFESQLADALDLAARSLRVGHPLPAAFQLIAAEVAPPIGTVFSEICQQQDLGMSQEAALRRASDQSPSPDMKLFTTAVVLQLQTGGNLADLMERLAAVIRDRMRLSRRVRVLTAQTQLSKHILLALPLVAFVIFNILNPKYMAPLYQTSGGLKLSAYALFSMILGVWIMNRISVIRY